MKKVKSRLARRRDIKPGERYRYKSSPPFVCYEDVDLKTMVFLMDLGLVDSMGRIAISCAQSTGGCLQRNVESGHLGWELPYTRVYRVERKP